MLHSIALRPSCVYQGAALRLRSRASMSDPLPDREHFVGGVRKSPHELVIQHFRMEIRWLQNFLPSHYYLYC